MSWQSSKVPRTATARTLASGTVVIWRRCTSDTRPSGYRMTTSTESETGQGRDGGRARVARRRPQHGDRRLPFREDEVEHRPDQLERIVLERQCGPPEQLEKVTLIGDRPEWSDVRMAKPPVDPGRHVVELLGDRSITYEGTDDGGCHGGVPLVGVDVGIESRPPLGHIESPVGRQSLEEHILELEDRCLSASGDVPHEPMTRMVAATCLTTSRSPIASTAARWFASTAS